ncbi:MAG: glutathione S-transferase domain-containing protein, partial [Alphaproteobacteria bacterium]|nr:glutathione S-transferase domain-containing protein [Alphaproteobacteria bacterium]
RAAACLAALADLMGEGPWLAGSALSLADLHAAPMFACLATAPENRTLLAGAPRIQAWWERTAARPSMGRTKPSFG